MAMCGIAISIDSGGSNRQLQRDGNLTRDGDGKVIVMGDGGAGAMDSGTAVDYEGNGYGRETAMQWETAILRHCLPSGTHPSCCGGGGRWAADNSGERGSSWLLPWTKEQDTSGNDLVGVVGGDDWFTLMGGAKI
jgi:hypothetical protein